MRRLRVPLRREREREPERRPGEGPARRPRHAGGGRALAVVNNPSDPTSWVAPTGFRKIVSTDNTDVANALGNGKATCYEHPVQLVLLEQSMRAAPGRAGTGAAALASNLLLFKFLLISCTKHFILLPRYSVFNHVNIVATFY